MHVEEILISTIPSAPAEELPPETDVINASLEQFDRFRFCRHAYELFNQRILSVKIEKPYRKDRDFVLNIGMLDPKVKRSNTIDWWCMTAVIIFSVTVLFPDATGITGRFPNPAVLPLVLGAGAVLCMLPVTYHFHERIVFYSRNGRIPLIALLKRNPDRETYNHFTEILIRHIKEAYDIQNSADVSLSEELKEHRRLMEEGFISKKHYDSAKRRILAQHH